ncbi:MAG: TatD family hydrolase [Planctomycetes bacterium]|nr:TatD family hydrolase [Planctomycetota bacterium]MCW8135056.1 TatD family hydrolase [Planctomycetota bacterium]
MLFDTHCHINFPDYRGEFDAMLQRAEAAGVSRMLCIGMLPQGGREALALARAHPGRIFASVGCHPYDAVHYTPQVAADFRELLCQPEVVLFGEMGIDTVKSPSPLPEQERAFEQQLELAGELNKPVCIHSREAFKICERIIRKVHPNGWKGFAHCFSDGPEEALGWKALGFKVSFAGQITFKNKSCDPIRAAAAALTPDDAVIETDAPFLAPQAMRGRRNEPAFVRETGLKLAEIWGLEPAQVFARTTANADKVLGL